MEVVIATDGDINDTQETETDTTTKKRTLKLWELDITGYNQLVVYALFVAP